MDRTEVDTEYPLNPLVTRWREKIRLANKFKEDQFGKDAEEAMKFFHCGKDLHDVMWKRHDIQNRVPHDDEEDMPAPRFRICVGKVAEGVELFGPTLYHKNPDIVVQPKNLEIPDELLIPLIPPEQIQQAQMAAQQQGQQFNVNTLIPPDPEENSGKLRAILLQYYLNYIQFENDKKTHSRRAIDEGIIKGAGILWTESFPMYPGGPHLIGSFHDTIDNLTIDPDSETIEECWWIARKRIQPWWEVADKFKMKGEQRKKLKEKYAAWESITASAETVTDNQGQGKHKLGKTNDLVEYWEIYSRMGMGHKLAGTKDQRQAGDDYYDDGDGEKVGELLDSFGENCYIAVCDRMPYPLNFNNQHLEELLTEPDDDKLEELKDEKLKDVSWPIPFWADGQWPCTLIVFHEVPNSPWPMSHFKPGLGYLKFLNWIMSFLINRVRHSCRTLAAGPKGVGDEFTERLFSGKDFEWLPIPDNLGVNGDINKLVSFLNVPELKGEVWKIIEDTFTLFDKATGLTEIMYGAPGGMRSAEEARMKGANASVRTDDMASKVEDALSMIARKEAMAARWLLKTKDVQPVLGARASLWDQFVAEADFETVAREFNYRVEAGSARKPNKDTQAQQVQQLIQVLPPMLQLAANPQAFPVVKFMVQKWAEANSYELPKDLLPNPVPQPNPEQQKIEAEIEQSKQELQFKGQESQMRIQEGQQKIALERQKAEVQLAAIKAKAQAEMQKAGMEMQTEQQKAQLEAQIAQEKARREVRLDEMDMHHKIAMGQQEMQLAQVEGQQNIAMQREEHRLGLQHSDEEHQQGMTHAEQQAKLAAQQAKQKPSGEKK